MYQLVYIEVNALCVLILTVILIQMNSNMDKQARNITFNRTALATMAILLLDILWALIENHQSAFSFYLNTVVNALYLFQTGVISYFWFIYVEHKLDSHINYRKRSHLLFALPLAALFVLCATSPWTGLLFYIDQNNVYHRGNLHFVQMLVSYLYMVGASVHLLLHVRREKSRQQRMELLSLLSFALLPAIGGLISGKYYGIPTVWPATTLSILMVFINFQSHQISTDGLTGLNNRRQFNKYLHTIALDTHKPDVFYLFLMDVNGFKSINDTLGHPEGDRALMQTAEILRRICNSRNAFLSRYGGDEFAILYRCRGAGKAEALKLEIAEAFDRYNKSSNEKFELTLSIGYEAFGLAHTASEEQLILAADQALYREKLAYKEKAKAK